MDPFQLSPAARAKIAQLCRAEGVDESYGTFVAQHLDVNDDRWRWCCSSNCDPCVERLGRVVDRARRALQMPGPGLPKADG